MNMQNSTLYQEEVACFTQKMDLSELNSKHILITGACGLIGTFMVDVLMNWNENNKGSIHVTALSRNRGNLISRFEKYMHDSLFSIKEQDVCTEFSIGEEQYDYIIHAASNTHPKEYAEDPVGTITTNVFGIYQILEYVKKVKDCRVLLLSSVEIYGENRGDEEYFSEEYCGYLNCNTLRAGYPESKRVSEAMAQAYIEKYNIDVVIARLCRVYGPTMGSDDSKAIAQFVKKTVAGENVILKSEGTQLFSYLYVADAVSAILTVLIKGCCGEAYNIADERSDISLKDIAEYLASIAKTKVVYELPDTMEQKGYSTAMKAMLDSKKIKSLGWEAQYGIQEGLACTVKILQEVN